MRFLECSGTPYEVGYQHGQTFAPQVRRCYDVYCHFPGTPAAEIDLLLDETEAAHRPHFPNLLAEIRGIADGAGMPYHDVLLLNFYADIVGERAPHCSNIGVAASPDGPLIAKTVDLKESEREFLFVQKVVPQEGQPYVHYVSMGTIWTEAGVTAAGLGHVCSGLVGRARVAGGVSVMALINMAFLSPCETVTQALGLLSQYEVAKWGATLLLADDAGDLALIEMLPGSKAIRRTQNQDDLLLHTNHAICAETRGMMGDADLAEKYGYGELIGNSGARYRNLLHLAPQVEHTCAGLQNVLRDHAASGAICQHGAAELHSAAGIVIAPRWRTMWGTLGYPCQGEFIPFTP
ncbi:MAG: hypothetical protein IT330_11495 [Anaerolineae bacterium]|nr:hypothetical protein [Anaerolineae bacterium]